MRPFLFAPGAPHNQQPHADARAAHADNEIRQHFQDLKICVEISVVGNVPANCWLPPIDTAINITKAFEDGRAFGAFWYAGFIGLPVRKNFRCVFLSVCVNKHRSRRS